MTLATKTFLAISFAGFIVGSTMDFGGFRVSPMLTAILPVGVTFLGAFLISLILEKEVARFDEEQRQKLAVARQRLVGTKLDKDL